MLWSILDQDTLDNRPMTWSLTEDGYGNVYFEAQYTQVYSLVKLILLLTKHGIITPDICLFYFSRIFENHMIPYIPNWLLLAIGYQFFRGGGLGVE